MEEWYWSSCYVSEKEFSEYSFQERVGTHPGSLRVKDVERMDVKEASVYGGMLLEFTLLMREGVFRVLISRAE